MSTIHPIHNQRPALLDLAVIACPLCRGACVVSLCAVHLTGGECEDKGGCRDEDQTCPGCGGKGASPEDQPETWRAHHRHPTEWPDSDRAIFRGLICFGKAADPLVAHLDQLQTVDVTAEEHRAAVEMAKDLHHRDPGFFGLVIHIFETAAKADEVGL